VPLDVAVQVINFRTRRHLGPCLRSVLADLEGAGFAARVLVLENGSGDDLSVLAAEHPEVEFVSSGENLGFGGGHNLLAARHDARALLLLNPDALLFEPRTIERLRAALTGDVAAVGPQLISPTGVVDPRDHGELEGFRARVAQAAGHSHYRLRDHVVDAAWVSGAACLVAREPFDAVGGFDPEFFLYKEEEDLFLRIRKQGGRILYLPSVRVSHAGGVTGARDAQLAASVDRFAAKHVHAPWLMRPVHRVVTVWGGRLDRLANR
jgi:N-acetylglucosaminyl-diphospho-decaprenol L-rhamnosyltransferase